MNETALDRFLRYVKIDTQSQEDADCYPSTAKQLDLLRLLATELEGLNLSHVTMNEYGYVMATLPDNIPPDHPARGRVPVIGLWRTRIRLPQRAARM